MKGTWSALGGLVLTCVALHAQEVDVETPQGTFRVRAFPNASQPAAATHQFDYAPGTPGKALLQVVTPEDARCQVYLGAQLVVDDTIPVSVEAKPDAYYRFVVTLSDGIRFDHKFAAKLHQVGTLRVLGPAPFVPAPVANLPPRAPPPQERVGMPSRQFQTLLGAIKREAFSERKTALLQSAARRQFFTCAQVGQLVDEMSFGKDRLTVVRLVKGRIVDPDNLFTLYEHFTFDSEKTAAQQVLEE